VISDQRSAENGKGPVSSTHHWSPITGHFRFHLSLVTDHFLLMLELDKVRCEQFAAGRRAHTTGTKGHKIKSGSQETMKEPGILPSWIPGFQIHLVLPLCTVVSLV